MSVSGCKRGVSIHWDKKERKKEAFCRGQPKREEHFLRASIGWGSDATEKTRNKNWSKTMETTSKRCGERVIHAESQEPSLDASFSLEKVPA